MPPGVRPRYQGGEENSVTSVARMSVATGRGLGGSIVPGGRYAYPGYVRREIRMNRSDSHCEIIAPVRLSAAAAGLDQPELCTRLSGAAGALHRFVRRRRPQRHHRAHPRPVLVGTARPAIHRRGPCRRRRQYRHAGRAGVGARRLHHRLRRAEQRHQPDALRAYPVRLRARLRVHRRHHEARQCHGCERRFSGQDPGRVHRHGESPVRARSISPPAASVPRRTCPANCWRS